jgi:hypothetical protein
MIHARPGHVAEFHGQAPVRPVVAFDDEGYALVLDPEAGRLVRAADLAGFAGIAGRPDTPVAMVPGGGRWVVRYTDDDGRQREEFVVAWSVTVDGVATPLVPREDPANGGVYVLPVRPARVSQYVDMPS